MKKIVSIWILSALSALFLGAYSGGTQEPTAERSDPLGTGLSARLSNFLRSLQMVID